MNVLLLRPGGFQLNTVVVKKDEITNPALIINFRHYDAMVLQLLPQSHRMSFSGKRKHEMLKRPRDISKQIGRLLIVRQTFYRFCTLKYSGISVFEEVDAPRLSVARLDEAVSTALGCCRIYRSCLHAKQTPLKMKCCVQIRSNHGYMMKSLPSDLSRIRPRSFLVLLDLPQQRQIAAYPPRVSSPYPLKRFACIVHRRGVPCL